MSTKLGRYMDGIMEAVWIAAIILTPLFFNKYSSRIFEPDKATLIRTLALIILGAWLIKLIEKGFLKTSGDHSFREKLHSFLKTPMVVLLISFAFVYFIATFLSVTPRISFWGSYQRLQGFYTTIAYMIMFASIGANLRKRSQVDRLITVAILTSLPVSLYGVLQRYGIDPIPWGGDVTIRVASHMGNSIFVAAYLIMVFPLVVGRIIDSFRAILNENNDLICHVARSTVYIFIAVLQLIAIYFSQSRGPFLGLLAGSYFLFILLSLHWKKRWLVGMVTVAAILVGLFLVLINIQDGPLESIRTAPWVGRFSQIFNMEHRNSKTRILIWEGAAEMVAPHAPLEYPDGTKDEFNFIRPLIGYGPETMHMAYNPFYPPELAHVEKRNASPDRSHNETWDSLVFTGAFGLLIYLGLFAAIFYYGLTWLGLINSKLQRILFFVLYFGGGILSAIVFCSWQGIGFFGVALPFGVIMGLIVYLTLSALLGKEIMLSSNYSSDRAITLTVLLAAIMAHFVEINFGIAIVATRSYFFIFMALLLVVGYILPDRGEYLLETAGNKSLNPVKTSRKRGKRKSTNESKATLSYRDIGIGSLITSLLLLPLFYEYISNMNGGTTALGILWSSLTSLNTNQVSYGVLVLILTTWFASSVLYASERQTNSLKTFVAISLISGGISLIYGFFLSGSLAQITRNIPRDVNDVLAQATSFENLLTQFYIFLLLFLLILARLLPSDWPRRVSYPSSLGVIFTPIVFLFVIGLSYFTNLRIIQADIAFKLAEPFTDSGQWLVANLLYQRAKDYAPDEDYYDLFLGRGYLEHAKTVSDYEEKQVIFNNAEADLKKAQRTNPLNPDHTANLARLNSWWASQTDVPDERQARGLISDQYYSRVLVLSPNNARLWAEWGALHFDLLDNRDRAIELINTALEVDPKYDWAYSLLGNYFLRVARQTENEAEREDAFKNSIVNFRRAIDLSKRVNYSFALATVYQAKNDIKGLIDVLEEGLAYAKTDNDLFIIEENLALAYFQSGVKEIALEHAKNALKVAPESALDRINSMILQIEKSPWLMIICLSPYLFGLHSS